MAYTFDPLNGDTRAQLVERVIANSFSAAKFTEMTRAWLNDAVTDVCRKLQIQRAYAILDFDATGTVAQPTAPFFHVEELWLAYATASGTGEQAFSRGAYYPLSPAARAPADMSVTNSPLYYTVRRQSFAGRASRPAITVSPAGLTGKVAIVGLTRPPVMTTDTDVSGLGADLDTALIAYARARAFEREDDMDMSDRWVQRYELSLRDVAHLSDQSDEPEVAEGAWPGDV